MALAPVPTTATRRPVRSWSCRQVAEWNAVPAKLRPAGDRGEGRSAELSAGGDQHVALERCAVGEVEHPPRAGLVEAGVGDLDPEADPGQHTEPRRGLVQVGLDLLLRRIRRVQSLMGAKEKEYRDAGMSQAAPG